MSLFLLSSTESRTVLCYLIKSNEIKEMFYRKKKQENRLIVTLKLNDYSKILWYTLIINKQYLITSKIKVLV
jgi:hypothetical protein